MQLKKIVYWLSTTILCGLMLFSAQMYLRNTEMVQGFFETYNYPSYIVIPLAALKILGVVMILWRRSKWLTEWAYAGFFFDLVLATSAHYFAGEGWLGLSFLGLLAVFPSYFLGKYLRDS
jgi:hypothetical protein